MTIRRLGPTLCGAIVMYHVAHNDFTTGQRPGCVLTFDSSVWVQFDVAELPNGQR